MQALPPLPSPSEVVAYWKAAGAQAWFRKDEAFDADFRARFLAAHEAAAGGALEPWAQSAEGALALVILLDQFPRNAFRGTARVHATDAKALQVADAALARGFDAAVDAELVRFFHLPFMHSERLQDQDRCVALAGPLGGEALRYALHHREIIRRFGRFPHRNALLGRQSTAEEMAYIAEGGFTG